MTHSNSTVASGTGAWTPNEKPALASVTYISPRAEAADVIAKRRAAAHSSPVAATAALAVLATVTAMVAAVIVAYRSGLRLQALSGEPPFGVAKHAGATANDTDEE